MSKLVSKSNFAANVFAAILVTLIVLSGRSSASASPELETPQIQALDATNEQVILNEMLGTVEQSLNAYIGLSKKLVSIATKLGKKKPGSKDRVKYITQANKSVASYLKTEAKIYKSYAAVNAKRGDSGILALVDGYYQALHKDLLQAKKRVSKRFGPLKNATVRKSRVPILAASGLTPISTQAADQCLKGLANQYANQMKQLTDQAVNAKDSYAGWAVGTGLEQARFNNDQLTKIQVQLKDIASVDAYNQFIAAKNAGITNFNAGVQNLNTISKDHPVITHNH